MNAKLYINKENLKYNIEKIKEIIGNKRSIIAMVKANAYGCGDDLISKMLQDYGVTFFGVANVKEAIALRKNGITGKILVTSVSLGDEILEAIKNDIDLSVSDIENITDIDNIAKSNNLIAKVHLKLDTGMTRLGFSYNEMISDLQDILKLNNIKIVGIYSHLSCADFDKEYTLEQIDKFKLAVEYVEKYVKLEYIHLLNSDGVLNYSNQIDCDTHVRVGIMMYGYATYMKPILKLTAPVIHINDVTQYVKVGYGGSYIAKPNSKIAVLKIGYADGLSRSLSNNIKIKIKGKECPLVGNICMDMCMVDITDIEDVELADEAVIFDYDNDLKELSKKSNKITYEFISTLGKRIERVIE